MTDHLGDDAELYALGLLPERRSTIEAHLDRCAVCRARVVNAEATAGALAATLPPAPRVRPRSTWSRAATFATAASAVLAVISAFEGVAAARAQAQIAQIDRGLAAIARSHFEHASFTPAEARAPVAKVIYARDRSWLEVVIVGHAPVHVIAKTANGDIDLGVPAVHAGDVATLYATTPVRVLRLDLRDEAGVVSGAALSPGL